MSRFVLLFHDCPSGRPRPSHWDLMLEQGEVLRTWALAHLPRDWAPLALRTDNAPKPADTNTVPAEPLGDHRLDFLQYEGPLSEGRGQVTRVGAGTFVTEHQSPDKWQARVAGEVVGGRITLSRPTADSNDWQLAYRPEGQGPGP